MFLCHWCDICTPTPEHMFTMWVSNSGISSNDRLIAESWFKQSVGMSCVREWGWFVWKFAIQTQSGPSSLPCPWVSVYVPKNCCWILLISPSSPPHFAQEPIFTLTEFQFASFCGFRAEIHSCSVHIYSFGSFTVVRLMTSYDIFIVHYLFYVMVNP